MHKGYYNLCEDSCLKNSWIVDLRDKYRMSSVTITAFSDDKPWALWRVDASDNPRSLYIVAYICLHFSSQWNG